MRIHVSEKIIKHIEYTEHHTMANVCGKSPYFGNLLGGPIMFSAA